jgi:hypothetical protein
MALTASAMTSGSSGNAKFTPPDAPYNGAFTRSVPIEVPSFFGITPKLTLAYDSGESKLQAIDGFSPLGVGWNLTGGSAVSRVSQFSGTPDFTTSDQFVLDGNKLMPCASYPTTPSCSAGGTHTSRYENYQRIVQNTSANTWTVTSRDGVISTYRPVSYWNTGGTQDARLRDSYRWLLSSVADADGNTITYSYDCTELPTCYVTQLSYGTSTIALSWETRPDTFTYATGISLSPVVDKRLKTIAVNDNGSLIRAYALSYTVSPDTQHSLLSSIQQYGSDATITSGAVTAGTSLPADTFTYTDMSTRRMGLMISDLPSPTGGTLTTPITTATEPVSPLVTNPTVIADYVFGDFNGDKKSDLIVTQQGTATCQAQIYPSGLWAGTSTTLSTPVGFQASGAE